MEKKKKFIFLISLLFFCSCIQSSVTSMAGNAIISEKGFDKSVSDAFLFTKIKSNLIKLNPKNLTNVIVVVSNGKVVLIGEIDSHQTRFKIVKSIWRINGVKELHNELLIGDNYNIYQKTKDMLLSSKIKTILLFNKEIYTNNYEIEVFNDTVYLVGIARNLEEHILLEDKIKKFSGGKKLISFVRQSKEIR
tara:strand:+ start:146 stop:721 length:576 start_codon:yes stop_codon:yes gene_type:complete